MIARFIIILIVIVSIFRLRLRWPLDARIYSPPFSWPRFQRRAWIFVVGLGSEVILLGIMIFIYLFMIIFSFSFLFFYSVCFGVPTCTFFFYTCGCVWTCSVSAFAGLKFLIGVLYSWYLERWRYEYRESLKNYYSIARCVLLDF